MIREEKKRSAGRPFLSHEQQRRFRRTQEQGRSRAVGRELDLVMEALSQGAIPDLIVVLQTVNKAARRNGGRVCASWPVEVDRMLTAIKPSLANGCGEVRHGTREIAVITFVVPGQASPDLMMKVIGPDGVEPPSALGLW